MPPEQDVFFESLYQNNFNGLVIYARAQLNDAYEAEEVVQDAFYTVLQQKEKLRHYENPRAYLISVLKFKIREYKRARSRYLKIFLSLNYDFLPEVPAPSNPYPVSISGIMEAARETLTEDEWHIFRRYVLNGYGHLRISKELGISVWASQKRLERIRKKLQDVLPEH